MLRDDLLQRLYRLDEDVDLSIEGNVIAKLYSPRTTDKRDIESDTILRALDWNLLDQLANRENEARASALNEYRYLEFKAKYEDYVRRFKP